MRTPWARAGGRPPGAGAPGAAPPPCASGLRAPRRRRPARRAPRTPGGRRRRRSARTAPQAGGRDPRPPPGRRAGRSRQRPDDVVRRVVVVLGHELRDREREPRRGEGRHPEDRVVDQCVDAGVGGPEHPRDDHAREEERSRGDDAGADVVERVLGDAAKAGAHGTRARFEARAALGGSSRTCTGDEANGGGTVTAASGCLCCRVWRSRQKRPRWLARLRGPRPGPPRVLSS